jgi:hypothetical protein
VQPFHRFIFPGMIRAVARRSEALPGDNGEDPASRDTRPT